MDQSTKTLADYLDLIKRRKVYIVVIWFLVSLTSLIVAYNLPKIYRSTATILIETPIPSNLFASEVSHYADVQIQSVYQRVMTSDNLFAIIESNGLYQDFKKSKTKFELAALFKKSTEVKLAKSNFSGMTEIVFDISFRHKEAIKAKEVASDLVTLFTEESDRSRTQRTIKVTDFLMEESDKLSRDLQEINNRIAKYKEENYFNLPEQVQDNRAVIERTDDELRNTNRQIYTLKDRVAFLGSALATTPKELSISDRDDDNRPQSREQTIRNLMAQYLRFSSTYSRLHPTMIRLKNELKALDPDFEKLPVEGSVQKQLAESKRELKFLEETHADNHPDLARHRKQINRLEQLVGKSIANPAYLTLVSQYRSSQLELRSLMDKRDYLNAKIEKIQANLLLSPRVEIEYKGLLRKQEGIIKKYTQLKEKWLDAKLVKTLAEQQGQQNLTIIEKPFIPKHPEKAVRRKVAIGGFIMGIIAGLGVAFFIEFMDPRVRGYREISEITGLMPLIVIPYMETPAELEENLVKQSQIRKIIVWASLTFILLASVIIVIFFLPLMQV